VTDYRNRRILAEAARSECWRTGPILRAATWTVAIELWRQAGRAAELGLTDHARGIAAEAEKIEAAATTCGAGRASG
jgi:hypothetical protein